MSYRVVTCFNEKLLKSNGSKLLEDFASKWDTAIEFDCYYYDMDIKNYSLPKAKNIHYYNLSNLSDYTDFIERNKEHNGTENGEFEYNETIDALTEAPKIFAISETMFNNSMSWVFWVDPHCYTMGKVTTSYLEKVFSHDNSEVPLTLIEDQTHFAAFQIMYQPCVDLIADLRGAYITDNFLKYRDWRIFFILNTLVSIYNAHGMNYRLLNSDTSSFVDDMLVDLRSPLAKNLRDADGNRVIPLSEDATTPDILPGRYKQLADLIRFYEPKKILETGTWNAGRAIEMSLAAFDRTDTVHYIGYDLFEDATSAIDKEEFNVKPHNTQAAVVKRLDEFAEYVKDNNNKTFTYELHKGNVRDVLTKDIPDDIDIALIGSGNSEQTVAHEFDILKSVPIVLMDHYFTKDEAEELPPEKYQGVNKVFDKIETNKVQEGFEDEEGWTNFDQESTNRKHILPSSDRVVNGGVTHLVVVLTNNDVKDIPEEVKRVPIVVHPRDSVPKEYITSNIQTNLKLIDEDKWIVKHPAHRDKGIIVSGGPYLDYDELKSFIKDNPTAKMLAVKHAYPNLLQNGIVPWGCIVLDPRPVEGVSTHNIVRKDLFKDVSSDTMFFVASMTDPSTTKHLKDSGANIWGWHAFTDSLREEDERGHQITNNVVKLNEELGIPQGATLITGGTCAAMRGIGMFHTMGFRDIHLFGFDCCRDEPTDEEKTETTGDLEGGETPKPKYIEVNVQDKTYWTTGELLAMAQDCEKVFADPGLEGVLSFHGKDTMVADLWDIQVSREERPTFEGYYS